MNLDSLSNRGVRAAGTPLRIDYDAFMEAEEDRYHPEDNPSGKLPLNIAENRLSWHELREKIEEITRGTSIPDWVPGYTSTRGAPEFREAAAHFLARHLTDCAIDPERLGVSAGATSVIETTCFALADAGDVAVIPAPCYPVYRQDMGNVPGVERFDLVTHHEPQEIARGPVLDVEHLEGALGEIEAAGKRFRMLVVTSPDNPTGGIHRIERLRRLAGWCIDHGIHMVLNEIYGLSLLDTDHPDIRMDYEGAVPFTSFAQVMADLDSDYLHLWYALSKDLGISGFRVGFLYSLNEALLQAYENFNLPHSISNHTQWLLGKLLTDDHFMDGYVARNQERLTGSYARVVRHLKRLDLPYVPARGSLFVWSDFSELMDGASEEAELGLWKAIFREAGVLLTPGVGFGHTKHGIFRIVHPCVEAEELEVAMKRLGRFVRGARGA
ncbi:MAG: aminotransferase class I/II-fold pyridoxal phosphate-dependent enzyme [Longimicrobiales bacterium]|nr:aminotransferase class I/II-fold pyridoxal phosphate-dependent enzyme [Longimicrobiales bacterium]